MTKVNVTKPPARLLKRFTQRQAGQALPLGIAFALVGMLGALVLYNTGQVAVDKQRLANASDSAAYSGMVWQARALNFQAYTNRAMVANQVAIGQAVSLYSWAEYVQTSAENAEKVLGPIPIVGQFVSGMSRIVQGITAVMKPIAQGMVRAIDPVNKAVKVAQELMYRSSFAATPNIVLNIAKASDPRFTANTAYTAMGYANNLRGWSKYTQEYTSEDNLTDLKERTELVNDSRDNFSEARYWDFFDNFWVYSTPFTKHKIFREGNTRLVMDVDDSGNPEWEWMAKDTMALETKIWRGWRGTKSVELPMGWGAAYANGSGSGDSMVVDRCRSDRYKNTESCRYRDRNKWTEDVADYFRLPVSAYEGINTFRSISETVRNPEEGEAVLKLKTEMSMDIEEVASSDRYVTNQDIWSTTMISPANKLSSISVAEVYYRRPEAYKTTVEHKKFEPANGYNPYWDVRLAPVDSADRLAALTLRDPGFASTSALPGGPAAEALANYDPTGGAGGVEADTDDGDGDGDSGESGGTLLASYEGETIYSALGVSEADVNALMDAAPQNFVVENIADYLGAQDIVDEIEEEVKDKIYTAATGFLSGIFQDFIDSSMPGLTQQVQNAQGLADSVLTITDDLSAQLEGVREVVGREFRDQLEAQVAIYQNDLVPLTTALGDFGTQLTDINNSITNYVEGAEITYDSLVAEQQRIQGEIAFYEGEVDRLVDGLKTDLTHYLIDRIDHHTGGILGGAIPFEEALDITTFMIDDYLEVNVDGYLEVPDELREEFTDEVTTNPIDLFPSGEDDWAEDDDI